MKLKPDECVTRFCRNCGKRMELSSYTSDAAFRWYHFHCVNCSYDVSLSEHIMPDFRRWSQSNGKYLEPLTKEEMESQNSPEGKEAQRKLRNDVDEEIKQEKKKREELDKHKLGDDDLEQFK